MLSKKKMTKILALNRQKDRNGQGCDGGRGDGVGDGDGMGVLWG